MIVRLVMSVLILPSSMLQIYLDAFVDIGYRHEPSSRKRKKHKTIPGMENERSTLPGLEITRELLFLSSVYVGAVYADRCGFVC